jgi:putative peptide maturation system protein
MNHLLQQAVLDALDYLMTLQHEGIRPREARAKLQPFRGRYPGLEIDLLLEEEEFDSTVHYDALLRRAGEGTVSLSYCPERVMPWPLRGVHRWSESDLVRVNANVLQVNAAIACLDFIWDEDPTIERLVNLCVIREELDRRPIDLTSAELQNAMDRFRAAKKLFKVEDTLRWLERHGMTHERLERYVAESAIVPKLRDRIAEGRIEEYFRQHQGDFDIARLARLGPVSENQACESARQIRVCTQNFFAVAERLFLESTEGSTRRGALFATVERRQAEPELCDQIFSAAPGALVGPVGVESGYVLVRVLEIIPAQLDGRTRAAIKDILFENWLAESRKAADIEWFWGNAGTTNGTEDHPASVLSSLSIETPALP